MTLGGTNMMHMYREGRDFQVGSSSSYLIVLLVYISVSSFPTVCMHFDLDKY